MAGAVRRPDLSGENGPRGKTVFVPGADDALRAFVAAEAPLPVEVVANPEAPLAPSDLAVLVVDAIEPELRAAVTRVIADEVPYVVLVRRDVWTSGGDAARELFDEVQRDPRRKLIRFWHDRDDLERTLREDVFALDDFELVAQSVRDGSFVKVGTSFEQAWVLENTGFVTWRDRALKELANDGLRAERPLVPIPPTRPGERVSLAAGFTTPDEPASCRSVWQIVGEDETVCFPWATGIWCQVLAVL